MIAERHARPGSSNHHPVLDSVAQLVSRFESAPGVNRCPAYLVVSNDGRPSDLGKVLARMEPGIPKFPRAGAEVCASLGAWAFVPPLRGLCVMWHGFYKHVAPTELWKWALAIRHAMQMQPR